LGVYRDVDSFEEVCSSFGIVRRERISNRNEKKVGFVGFDFEGLSRGEKETE